MGAEGVHELLTAMLERRSDRVPIAREVPSVAHDLCVSRVAHDLTVMARQTGGHARLRVASHLRRLRHVVEALVLVRGGMCNERVAAVAIGMVEVVPAQARQKCCLCGRWCVARGQSHLRELDAHGQGR